MDDGQTLRSLVRDDAYVVERVLADGPSGRTEIVSLDGEGPLVRKRIPLAIANASAWAAAMEADEPLLPRIESLYRMPDVLVKPEVEVLDEAEWQVVRQGVVEALQHLLDFRTQEGAALERKFSEKIDNIEKLLASIEPYEKSRVEKIRSRIVDSLKQIPEAEYDKNRLEQELIYYIEKLDINEEKQRLTNHLKYFRETMNDLPGQGKKLGFIAQEMGREINTTGSKSNQAEMQNIVVKMKDELEQIKEQVLNAL
jgi:uncharacterized protein (TIGR00255 family)